MPRCRETVNPVQRPGNTNRAFGPHLVKRPYDLWKRQVAVYAAAARRQTQPGRRTR